MKALKLNFISFAGSFMFLLVLSSCSGGLNGTYIGDNNRKLKFISGSKVERTEMGFTLAGKYEKDGDKLKITIKERITELIIDKDGCLDGGSFGKFCKVKE